MTSFNTKTEHRAFLFAFLIISLFCYLIAPYQWIPHDEGQLGQSAERVLQGELPHIDFDNVYTGALAQLHACVFKYFGNRLVNLRYTLLFFLILSIWPVFSLLKNYFSAWQSASLTIFIFLTTFPSYFVALPSWYMCLIAIWLVYLLHFYCKSEHWFYLSFSGVLIALSILLKINGLFLLCASLFFIYIYQLSKQEKTNNNIITTVLFLLVAFGIGTFLYLLTNKIGTDGTLTTYLFFLLPISLISIHTLLNSRYLNAKFIIELICKFTLLLVPFALTLSLFFFSFYELSDFNKVIEGVIINPQKRVSSVSVLPMSFLNFSISTAVTIAALGLAFFGSKSNQLLKLVLLLPLLVLFYNFYSQAFIFGFALIYIVALSTWFFRKEKNTCTSLLLIFYAFFSLIQFPFFHLTYFLYSFPILILAISINYQNIFKKILDNKIAATLICLLIVANLCMSIQYQFKNEARGLVGFVNLHLNHELQELELKNSGLIIPKKYVEVYQGLDQILKENKIERIIATPDSPEIYYLLDKKNYTPAFFETLSDINLLKLMHIYKDNNIQAIIVNNEPKFSKEFYHQLGIIHQAKQDLGGWFSIVPPGKLKVSDQQ